MTQREATVTWRGDYEQGHGEVKLESGLGARLVSEPERTPGADATDAEELVAAALAASFSVDLVARLQAAGYSPEAVHTSARVKVDEGNDGLEITELHLVTHAICPDLDAAELRVHAEASKKKCPVGRLVWGAEITLDASLATPRALRSTAPMEESAP